MKDENLDDRTTLNAEQITNLLKVCLRTTYFVFNKEYYEQQNGAAMGSPVSPIVANLFMEHFEETALDTRFRFWKRYVDDIFCIIKSEFLDESLLFLNSLFPSIQLTSEVGTNGSLPFLDVLVSRFDDGTMKTSVHRKSTHTDRYISYNSNHAPHVKKGIVQCLLRRSYNLSSESSLKNEIDHVRSVLSMNGYPRSIVDKVKSELKKKKKQVDTTTLNEDPVATAVIPYVSTMSERIRKILWDYGIRTSFKTKTTLSNILTKVKDPTSNENKVGAVYKVMCECGDFYIGESGRALGIRIKEHKSACEHGYSTKSPLAEHVWQEGSHVILWNQVKLLDFSQGMVERRVKEAIYINMSPNNLTMNRDSGMELSPLVLRAARGHSHK